MYGNICTNQIYKTYEKSASTTEPHYSLKKQEHSTRILKSFFLFDTRQSMKCQKTAEQ